MNNYFTSIIIPSHNRCVQLLNCLEALNVQTYNSNYFEVIVVADSCTDNTYKSVSEFAVHSKFHLELLNHSQRKASVSRNNGIKKAKGDILIFLDDDVLPSIDFVKSHVDCQNYFDVVIGYLETILPEKPSLWQIKAKIWWESCFEEMSQPCHVFHYKNFFTGNVSIRTSLIKKAGLFDETLNRLEDYEFGYRLVKSSAKFHFSYEAKGKHFETNDLKLWASRLLHEGDASYRMGQIYPELRNKIFPKISIDEKAPYLIKLASKKIKLLNRFIEIILLLAIYFEKIKARTLWQKCSGIISQYNFWRGVFKNFNSLNEFYKWVNEFPVIKSFDYDNANKYDLKSPNQINFSDQGLELLNKHGLRLTLDDLDLFLFVQSPENEIIRKEHLPYIRNQDFFNNAHNFSFSWNKLINRRFEFPIQLVDIDITQILSSLTVKQKYGYLAVNIFIKDRPIGIFAFNCRQKKDIPKDELYFEIQKNFLSQIKIQALLNIINENSKNNLLLPTISIIICTRNRSENLKRCLESIRFIEYPLFEVIVVDNCPEDDATYKVVREYGFNYTREDRVGLNYARNKGIKESKNDIVAFIDDDAIATKGWLNGIGESFKDKNLYAVTGLILPAELETEAQLDFEFYGGMGKGYIPYIIHFEELEKFQQFWASSWGAGTNMAFRKEIFTKISDFNVLLDVGTPTAGGGDIEFLYRVVSAGYRLKYEPSALVKHYHRQDKKSFLKQIYNNGKSFPAYLLSIRKFSKRKHLYWFAFRYWFIDWLLKRLIKSLLLLDKRTLTFVLTELRGFLLSAYSYKKSKKNKKILEK